MTTRHILAVLAAVTAAEAIALAGAFAYATRQINAAASDIADYMPELPKGLQP